MPDYALSTANKIKSKKAIAKKLVAFRNAERRANRSQRAASVKAWNQGVRAAQEKEISAMAKKLHKRLTGSASPLTKKEVRELGLGRITATTRKNGLGWVDNVQGAIAKQQVAESARAKKAADSVIKIAKGKNAATAIEAAGTNPITTNTRAHLRRAVSLSVRNTEREIGKEINRLNRSIKGGKIPTEKQIEAKLSGAIRKGQRAVDHRTYTIISSETVKSSRAVMEAVFDDATDKGYIDGWEWVAVKDANTCEQCTAMDGRVFTNGEIFQALHPHCRCYPAPYIG